LEHVWKTHSGAFPHQHFHPILGQPKHELDLIADILTNYRASIKQQSPEQELYKYLPASKPFFPEAAEFDNEISAAGASSVRGSLHCSKKIALNQFNICTYVPILIPRLKMGGYSKLIIQKSIKHAENLQFKNSNKIQKLCRKDYEPDSRMSGVQNLCSHIQCTSNQMEP